MMQCTLVHDWLADVDGLTASPERRGNICIY